MLATLLAAATLTSASLSLNSFKKGGRTSDLHVQEEKPLHDMIVFHDTL